MNKIDELYLKYKDELIFQIKSLLKGEIETIESQYTTLDVACEIFEEIDEVTHCDAGDYSEYYIYNGKIYVIQGKGGGGDLEPGVTIGLKDYLEDE